MDVIQRHAIHEAGHATVATYLGGDVVERVVLWRRTEQVGPDVPQPDGTSLRTYHDSYGAHAAHYIEASTPLDQIAVATAGLAAESVVDPGVTIGCLERDKATDYRHVCEALDLLVPAPNPKQRKQHIERQFQRSRAIIAARWPGVQRLANALIDEKNAAELRTPNASEIRAELSGETLAELLAFAK